MKPILWVGIALTAIGLVSLPTLIGPICPDSPGEVAAWTGEGWTLYRASDLRGARDRFGRAAACAPDAPGPRVGLGYVALREDRLEQAEESFRTVLEADPDVIDALLGSARVAWRRGEQAVVASLALRVQRLEPENAAAHELLAGVDPGYGTVEREPFVRPDTVAYPARTRGDRFEVRDRSGRRGWRPFYIKGVNLGAALPGRHPSEFPDSVVYAEWIASMAEMGANTVRVYTIHPPDLYEALLQHNAAHPERPLWLVHGVWTGLPPGDDFFDTGWESGFFAEMSRVVDLVHGRADVPPRPGHAAGHYTADVSPWTLGYIIGREWEPHSIQAFNEAHPELTSFEGRYIRVERGNAAEVWMARASDRMIDLEMRRYNAQRPIAYTNWPTLDKLRHPTESTVDEEMRIREVMGEVVDRRPKEYDNDAVGLDAAAQRATAALPAGLFAAFHAYPYYPDFMTNDPGYAEARSPFGRSNYFGYLRELKAAHPGMPLVIAEYGVPASLGIAHLQPQGWHHGGLTEAEMARADARLTREIEAAGLAGGMLFAWIDEWFKKNWLAIDFEIPLDRNRLWLNRLDAEQHYGVIAMEPGEVVPGGDLRGRLAAWRARPPALETRDGQRLRLASDEAYLWLLIETGASRASAAGANPEILVGFDIADPEAGDFSWPGRAGERLPVGIEFVLRVTEKGARLMVDPPSNPFRLKTMREGIGPAPAPVDVAVGRPPGLFSGRVEGRYRSRYVTEINDDGWFEPLRVVTNRPRFDRDGAERAALGYDRGVLPRGEGPDGLFELLEDEGVVEVRIPWMLLNVTDPSQRRILQGAGEATGDEPDRSDGFGTMRVNDIGLLVATGEAGAWTGWKTVDGSGMVARYGWPTWETPTFRSRRRPVFEEMRRAFASMTGSGGRAIAAGGDR